MQLYWETDTSQGGLKLNEDMRTRPQDILWGFYKKKGCQRFSSLHMLSGMEVWEDKREKAVVYKSGRESLIEFCF